MRFLICLFLHLSFFQLYAQTPSAQWVQTLKTNQSTSVMSDVVTDPSGAVISVGYYSGDCYFSDTLLTSGWSPAGFISKYNCSGGLEWATSIVGKQSVFAQALAIDGAENLYITGFITDTASFDNLLVVPHSKSDVFVAKYSPKGKALWAKSFAAGTLIGFHKLSITADLAGNSYICGTFYGDMSLDGVPLACSGSSDMYVAKFATSGQLQWAKRMGGKGFDFAGGIAADALGNTYMNGAFNDTLKLGNIQLTQYNQYTFFVCKIDSKGNFRWAKRAEGEVSIYSQDIAIDAKGNSYNGGLFISPVQFGSTYLTRTNTTFSGEMYLVKYDSTGAFQWAVQPGGSEQDELKRVGADAEGNVAIVGSYKGNARFGTTLLSNEWVFVAKYTTNGQALWAQDIKAIRFGYANGVDIKSGNFYFAGIMSGEKALFDTLTVPIQWTGGNDAYLAKYIDYVPTALPSASLQVSGTTVCEGALPEVKIFSSQTGVFYQLFYERESTGQGKMGNGGEIRWTVNSPRLKVGPNTIQVRARNSQCVAIWLKDTAHVEVLNPKIYQVQDGISCAPDSVKLYVGGTVEEFRWYKTATSTQVLQNGTTFRTGILTATDSFYVSAFERGCESKRVKGKAILNPKPIFEIVGPQLVAPNVTAKYYVQDASKGNSYWFLKGATLVSSATDTIYLTIDSSFATIYVTRASEHYCLTSDSLEITRKMVTGMGEGVLGQGKVYMYKEDGSLSLKGIQVPGGLYEITVATVLGQIVHQSSLLLSGTFDLPFSSFSKGNELLFLKVVKDGQPVFQQVLR